MGFPQLKLPLTQLQPFPGHREQRLVPSPAPWEDAEGPSEVSPQSLQAAQTKGPQLLL